MEGNRWSPEIDSSDLDFYEKRAQSIDESLDGIEESIRELEMRRERLIQDAAQLDRDAIIEVVSAAQEFGVDVSEVVESAYLELAREYVA